MSIFGGSYPAGCSGPPDDGYVPYCDVCRHDCDECICPECPECGESGNPKCYPAHGLSLSKAQLTAQAKDDARLKEEAELDRRHAQLEAQESWSVSTPESERWPAPEADDQAELELLNSMPDFF